MYNLFYSRKFCVCHRCEAQLHPHEKIIRLRGLPFHVGCVTCGSCRRQIAPREQVYAHQFNQEFFCRPECLLSMVRISSNKDSIFLKKLVQLHANQQQHHQNGGSGVNMINGFIAPQMLPHNGLLPMASPFMPPPPPMHSSGSMQLTNGFMHPTTGNVLMPPTMLTTHASNGPLAMPLQPAGQLPRPSMPPFLLNNNQMMPLGNMGGSIFFARHSSGDGAEQQVRPPTNDMEVEAMLRHETCIRSNNGTDEIIAADENRCGMVFV